MKSEKLAHQKRRSLFEKHEFNSLAEEILHFIDWVTLAPSTHNSQPWLFEVIGKRVTVRVDKDKAVTEADPTSRDMFISAGALVRHIELVGNSLASVDSLSIETGEKNDIVSRFEYGHSESWSDFYSSELADAIAFRQNYRGSFDTKEVPADYMNVTAREVANDVGAPEVQLHIISIDKPEAASITRLTGQGIEKAYKSPAFRREVSEHINSNFSSKESGLHGYSLTMNDALSVLLPRLMKRIDIGSKLAKLNLASMNRSQGIVIITSEKDSCENWIDTGRVLADYLIKLKTDGIQASIYAAAIEVDELRMQVQDVLPNRNSPQLLFTYGYPTQEIGYSHRQNAASITTFR